MSDFVEATLASVVLESRPITYGIVQPGPDISPDGVPLIRGKDYSSGKVATSGLYHVSPSIDRPYARSRVRGGDLLLSIVGYVGQVAQVPAELDGANITQTTARISVDPEKVDCNYLLQYLGAPHFRPEITRYEKGSAQPGLNLSDVQRLKIKYPPSQQRQQRIAEILSTADEAIEQTEALIAKYQQIKAGLMHDLFTRGVTPDGHLRPTRAEAQQLYKEEPRFGWIPKEWQPENFGEKIELVHGYQFRDFDFVEDGIPVVKIGQVTEDGLDLSTCSFVSRDRLNSFQEIQIKSGDVLMALTGATLGKTCMVEETNTDLLQNYRVGRFEPRKPQTVHKGFLFALLGFSKVRRQIFDKVNSGAQGNVGKGDFERVRICLPPYDEQLLIHEVVGALQRRIKTEQLAVAKLRAKKQGLMQDLLAGRVPVRI